MTGPKRPPANPLAPPEAKVNANNSNVPAPTSKKLDDLKKMADSKRAAQPQARRKPLQSKRPIPLAVELATKKAIETIDAVNAGKRKSNKSKLQPLDKKGQHANTDKMQQIQDAISKREAELLENAQTESSNAEEKAAPAAGQSPAALRRQHVEQMANLRANPVVPPLRVDIAAALRQKTAPKEQQLSPKAPQNKARPNTPPLPKGARGLFNSAATNINTNPPKGPPTSPKKYRRGG